MASSAEVLDVRALNRATLARQLLLRREERPAIEVITHLVGLQAQAPSPPYFGLWSRLDGFQPDELAGLINDRSVVRLALMRGTIHLVTADDALSIRPLVQPVLDRALQANRTFAAAVAGLTSTELDAAGRAELAQQPLTAKELGARLVQRFPGRDPSGLANAIRALVPLVQVPPRGIWGASGQATLTTAESWLGRPLASRPGLDQLVLRYLAAFGPATARDVQVWSGLTRLREVIDGLGARLRRFRTESGAELYDLPDAPRPDPDTPAPARLLAEYDNVLLSHADRGRILTDEHRERVFFSSNGMIPGTVLVDGFVQGTWRLVRQRDAATLRIETLSKLRGADTAAISQEAGRLLALAAPDAARRDVQVVLRPGDAE